jgi:hypothetical protein
MKITGFTFLIFLGLSFNSNGQSGDTTIWTIMLGGNKAGFLKQWRNADGSLSEWYQVNDRGRGDSTVTTYKYDDKGYITYLNGKGIDYYKKPVSEKFENLNGLVRWENAFEKEERKIDYKADYLSLNISAGTNYSKYFNAPGQTIKLLPSGESQLAVLKEHVLKDKKHIRLISTFGSGLTPSYTWIDENNEWFASPGDWYSAIRLGYESYNDELSKIRDGIKQVYFKDLTKKLTETTSGLVIKNASLFDSKKGTVQKNATITINNGVVREITAEKNSLTPKGYKVIDAAGKFVMPGLWDNHVHSVSESAGLINIGCGITNVRDMGSGPSLLTQKKQIDDGTLIGPRIQAMCGFIDGAGEFAGPIGEKIKSVEEGRIAIKKYADLGYQQIKLYSSIKPEWVKPLADDAKKLGLRVSGHIPAHMLAIEAVADGYDEIQHTNMLFLNFYGKELDTRTPLRFTEVAKRAADFDFEQPEFKSLIETLKQHKTVVDPTVSFFENMFSGKAGEIPPGYTNFALRLPLTLQRSFKTGSSLQIPEGMEETYKNSFFNMLKMVKKLYDNDITIIPGTDSFTGFMLHRELENYVKAGIPNKDVLKLATFTSAVVNRKSDMYGNIEPNRPADIIIINGNPLINILDIQNVEVVIKDKAIYQTKDILKAVAIESPSSANQ